AFWEQYIREVLRRHGLPDGVVTTGTGGTFPTFLVGAYVVKFFPKRFDGGECFLIERSLHTSVLENPDIPAPRHVAHGQLFETGWRWPYLVTTRVDGSEWRHARISFDDQLAAASQLGSIVRCEHDNASPDDKVWRRDLIGELRDTCAVRVRDAEMLPTHLVDQIDGYLVEPSDLRRLVHGDLHGDHVFVNGGRVVGIIDWGDALYGDPYYELPALFFGTFAGSKRLLRVFLDAYGWEVTSDFADRAMTMTLLHEFAPLGRVLPPLSDVQSLHELAVRLWQLS